MSVNAVRKLSLIVTLLGLIFLASPLINIVTLLQGKNFIFVAGILLILAWLGLIFLAHYLSTRLHDQLDNKD